MTDPIRTAAVTELAAHLHSVKVAESSKLTYPQLACRMDRWELRAPSGSGPFVACLRALPAAHRAGPPPRWEKAETPGRGAGGAQSVGAFRHSETVVTHRIWPPPSPGPQRWRRLYIRCMLSIWASTVHG